MSIFRVILTAKIIEKTVLILVINLNNMNLNIKLLCVFSKVIYNMCIRNSKTTLLLHAPVKDF